MFPELPDIFSLLSRRREHMQKYAEHYSNIRGLVETAISAVPQRNSAFIPGVGFGIELPEEIWDFEKVCLNDIIYDELLALVSAKVFPIDRNILSLSGSDVTGLIDPLITLFEEMNPQSSSDKITGQIKQFIRHRTQVKINSLQQPADISISSMLLTQTWRYPLEYIDGTVKEIFSLQKDKQEQILNGVARLNIPDFLFYDHLGFLKRHTDPQGAIVLVTEVGEYINEKEVARLPQNGEVELWRLVLYSQIRFGKNNFSYWDWRREDTDYHVLGLIVDPGTIPDNYR